MPEITNDIVKRTFENFLTNHQNLNNIKCLDFMWYWKILFLQYQF